MLSEGCEGMLEALFRVLDLAGDKAVGVNRDSLLECGHLPYTCGEHDQAMKEAAAARKRWGRYSRLLFASPHCASFVKTQWPLAGLDRSKQATTLLEYVAAGLDFSSPGFFKKSVAYHDPCHLGRHLHLYQLPRDILSWATNSRPVELLGSRERGTCCGGGYPLSLHAPQVADDIARLLAGFFADSRADVLVTACARCATRMAAAIPGGRVMHILEVIAERRR
jgi:Fe-S oxidoreductase